MADNFGLKIGLEGEKEFKKALADINSSFKVLGSEMKLVSYLSSNPMGVTAPTLTVAFEPLWKQPEYAAVLERVSLCDTVTIRHSVLGITAKAKVIKTVYDTLSEKYVSITLGSTKANLINTVSQAEAAAQAVSAKVDRFPALMTAAIQNATNLITGQSGGYVVINTNEATGEPYELLVMDAPSMAEGKHHGRIARCGLQVRDYLQRPQHRSHAGASAHDLIFPRRKWQRHCGSYGNDAQRQRVQEQRGHIFDCEGRAVARLDSGHHERHL